MPRAKTSEPQSPQSDNGESRGYNREATAFRIGSECSHTPDARVTRKILGTNEISFSKMSCEYIADTNASIK